MDQGDCSRFKKSGFIPTSCSKSTTIFDMTAEVPQNQKMDGCCKGGVLLSRVQSYHNSTTAFQIAIGGEGSSNATWQRLGRWNAATNRRPNPKTKYYQISAVSLYPLSMVKKHDRLVSKIECTNHMCPVNINWQVIKHQRRVRVTISNLNYGTSYQDWIMLADHPAFDNTTTLLHANHKFLSPNSYSKMEVVWGRRGYNGALAPFGKKGSTINMVMVFKNNKPGHHGIAAGEWKKPPNAIFFNGDRCVIPQF
ncbi:COBRA-like protein 1 [Humulus lupulus]|uniref:COBRA-like protein 1 n=1 Tax=Humulus lupulus TaxID=3486 RepID=UPI002B413841|nr:COBRA-like protein 1 [Humulus lupulus]